MAAPLPAYRCSCGKLYPARAYSCSACGGAEVQAVEIAGTGTLYSFTTIRAAPPAMAGEAPYHLALVEFPGGLRVLGRVEAPAAETLAIGAALEVDRVESRGPVFRPKA
jgi:hypothetical protein